jgi:pectate lyase
VKDVDLGGSTNDAPSGSLSVPYSYSVVGSANAKSANANSGATLSF